MKELLEWLKEHKHYMIQITNLDGIVITMRTYQYFERPFNAQIMLKECEYNMILENDSFMGVINELYRLIQEEIKKHEEAL